MKFMFNIVSLFVFVVFLNTVDVDATLLTFDDINIMCRYNNNLYIYKGLLFENTKIIDTRRITVGNFSNADVSKYNIIYNDDGKDLILYRMDYSQFDLNSAYLTAGFRNNDKIKIEFFPFFNSSISYSKIYNIYNEPTRIVFDIEDVYMVKFSSVNDDIFTIDNLDYSFDLFCGGCNCNIQQPIPTPEPLPIILLGSGLIILSLMIRKNSSNCHD